MKFSDIVTELDNGRVHEQLSEELEQIVDGVQTHGTKGQIVITLDIKKEGDRAVIGCSSKAKIPKAAMHGTLYYFGRNGGLSREDPRQLSLKTLAPETKKEAN